jgi:nucleoside-diphosphate-sugar epimerase
MKQLWLVTGLKGELGRQLSAELSRQPMLELRPLDLSQPAPGAKRVLHLAARRPVHSLHEQIESNIFYLRRVLGYAAANRIPEFVFFSSASLYASVRQPVLREAEVNFPWRDTYSWTKWIGEKLTAAANIPSKLILRMPAVLEMDAQTNFISRAFENILAGREIKCTHRESPFNRLISGAETARFLLHTQGGLARGTETVNLAPQADHTLQEHLAAIGEVLGKAPVCSDSEAPSPHAVLDSRKLAQEFHFKPKDSVEMVRAWAQGRAQAGAFKKASGR